MAVSAANRFQMTAEEFAAPEVPEKFVELVEGEVVQMTPADGQHNRISFNSSKLFARFCSDHPELDFGGDNDGFLIARNPDSVLSPDASLFRRRKHYDRPWRHFSPELVVEVLSPAPPARS